MACEVMKENLSSPGCFLLVFSSSPYLTKTPAMMCCLTVESEAAEPTLDETANCETFLLRQYLTQETFLLTNTEDSEGWVNT